MSLLIFVIPNLFRDNKRQCGMLKQVQHDGFEVSEVTR
jgi:hypothetical protein